MLLRALFWSGLLVLGGGLLLMSAARALGDRLPAAQIAFMSYVNINPDIFIIDARQRLRVNLTRGRCWNASPAWSPDGEWIAYANDCADGRAHIYVMHWLRGQPRRLTPDGGGYSAPRWSRDGKQLVFFAHGSLETVYAVNVDGSEFRQITSSDAFAAITRDLAIEPSGINESRAPDGVRIAFIAYREGSWGVYIADDGIRDNARLIARMMHYGEMLAWSPDGALLAFTAKREGMSDLYIARAADGALTRLTHDRAIEAAPSWRPR